MAQLEKFKLQAYSWDGDKDPTGFHVWIETFGSVVRSLQHGPLLEDMLDSKLKRTQHDHMVSSVLLADPDFQLGANAAAGTAGEAVPAEDDDAGGGASSAASSASGSGTGAAGGSFALGQHAIAYCDLPDAAKELDQTLYNILRLNVKGSKNALLSHVTFNSYVQGVIVLHHHINISRMDRIIRAFNQMDKCVFKGSALAFQTEFLGLRRELDVCGATMQHYSLCRLMRAFDGKSKNLQYKIAEDFNDLQIEQANIYDLLQKYCSFLASVGDGTSRPVNTVVCHHCNTEGHKRPDCPKLKAERDKAEKKKKNDDAKKDKKNKDKKIVCHHCNVEGHKRPDCPKLKAEQAAAAASASGQKPATHPVQMASLSNSSALSPQQLQQILNHVRGSSVNHVLMAKAKSPADSNSFKVLADLPDLVACDEEIALSVCDGIGTAAFVMEQLGVQYSRFIGVEIDPVSRTICDNLNPPETTSFSGVDHSWHTDVFSVTRDHIVALGRGNIKSFFAAPPCGDHSVLRLLFNPKRPKQKLNRPGFKGPKGKVFLQCLQIYIWVLELNPDVELFWEFTLFDDMLEDWELACQFLGIPLVLDAADCSATRRVRCYFNRGLDLPTTVEELLAGLSPVDANALMEPGRTVEPYVVDGKTTVRTVVASWGGNPHQPESQTAAPILVHDQQFEKAQDIVPVEAERFLGYPDGSTAGRGVTAKDRLSRLGAAWDVRAVKAILKHSKLPRSKLVEGQAKPLCSVALPDDAIPLSGLSGDLLKSRLLEIRATGGTHALVQALQSVSYEDQVRFLAVLMPLSDDANYVGFAGSVLDSGSSRHLHPKTCVTQPDDSVSLTGFNGDSTWTQGNGYLPLSVLDASSDTDVSHDIHDVDKLDSVVSPVLSMGKLIRMKWKFRFDGPDELVAYLPGQQCSIRVDLGDDDILRLPHELRQGKSSVPLPQSAGACLHVKRTPSQASFAFLHSVFCHRGAEKIYRTLLNTKGYKAERLEDIFCDVCAQIKAKRKGLSHGHKVLAGYVPTEQDYQDDNDNDELTDDELEEFEYVAPVVGRSLGTQSVPRFNLDELRPFEVMFADNKDYEMSVRGGRQVAFVLYDVKSTAKFKVDLFKKSDNGLAFRKIVALNGIHKLPYHCMIYTDGCGSMAHVELAAITCGLNHAYVPPHEQSLNEAEKICYLIWDDAAAIIAESKSPSNYFNYAVDFALYSDMRSATTAERGWKTPYEIIKGVQPSILNMHRWFTLAHVTLPRQKRKALAKKGFIGRAETGRFLGFQSIFSSTFRVMLDRGRLVHNINVTFNDNNFVNAPVAAPPDVVAVPVEINARAQLEEQVVSQSVDSPPSAITSPVADLPNGFQNPTVVIEHCDLFDQFVQAEPPQPQQEYFDITEEGDWLWQNSEPQARPRPSYAMLISKLEDSLVVSHPDKSNRLLCMAIHEFVNDTSTFVDHSTLNAVGTYLAFLAQKDIKWKKALSGPDRDLAIAAFHAERDSLLDTVLELLDESHPDYAEAKEAAITGRYLLDIRRNSMYKARGVKQGFKEDKATADGPGFNYYSHVAKLYSVRMSYFRPNRGTRRVAIRDVRTAFLQSDKFPASVRKFLKMYHPIELKWELFRQLGPLYGENSAPVRWEDTFAPYLESEDFVRGDNEMSVFYNEDHDLLDIAYVDDNFLDGDEDSIKWGSEILSDRFDCKELEWLEPDRSVLDYLGMELFQDATRVYISMETYISNCLDALGWSDITPRRSPMVKPIDPDSPALDIGEINRFHTGKGFLTWLSNTNRPDISYSFSRIGQHQANPTTSAMDALKHCFQYLSGTRHLTLSGRLYTDDVSIQSHLFDTAQKVSDQLHWEFYCDSDFAGNREVQNKARSQNGYIALLNQVPVYWQSKVSSVAFASPHIGEAHADMSSGAAEVYCAGNATMDFLHLSYVAEEMNIPFPRPFVLQMDNEAAKCFANNSCFKSKLKHIDQRQHWVKILRDKDICVPVHVPTADNLADIFTKILPVSTFETLRDKLMHDPNSSTDC